MVILSTSLESLVDTISQTQLTQHPTSYRPTKNFQTIFPSLNTSNSIFLTNPCYNNKNIDDFTDPPRASNQKKGITMMMHSIRSGYLNIRYQFQIIPGNSQPQMQTTLTNLCSIIMAQTTITWPQITNNYIWASAISSP